MLKHTKYNVTRHSVLLTYSGSKKLPWNAVKHLAISTPVWKCRFTCRSKDREENDVSNKQLNGSLNTNVSATTTALWKHLVSFLSSNVLPLALISGLALGLLWPELGAASAKTQLQTVVVVAIFIVSGLQLKQGDAMKALRSTDSVAFGKTPISIANSLPISEANTHVVEDVDVIVEINNQGCWRNISNMNWFDFLF